jgi:hypothetical protein
MGRKVSPSLQLFPIDIPRTRKINPDMNVPNFEYKDIRVLKGGAEPAKTYENVLRLQFS